jgi:uncharacterized membrane protein
VTTCTAPLHSWIRFVVLTYVVMESRRVRDHDILITFDASSFTYTEVNQVVFYTFLHFDRYLLSVFFRHILTRSIPF